VADSLEFAELMCTDALARDESRADFGEEHQRPTAKCQKRTRRKTSPRCSSYGNFKQ
jgi:hypothetical protein